MEKAEKNEISKTSRQLIIFHIFLYSTVIEVQEITRLIQRSNKTIIRDLQELQHAGLLGIKFSRREKGYVHIDDDARCPFSAPSFSDNRVKNRHFEKLIRLATIMIELRYHTEVPYDEDGARNQETCSSWYKKKFPSLSKRTMQRDFEELNNIGYEIKYSHDDKCYMLDFPEGLEGIENRLKELQK